MSTTTETKPQTASSETARINGVDLSGIRFTFVYRPDGVAEEDAQQWPLKIPQMTNDDAEAIEELTGWTIVEWEKALWRGSIRARRALLYTFLRRGDDDLDYAAVKVKVGELDIVMENVPAEALAELDDEESKAAADVEESAPKA